ncbi:MAG: hypothetical protein ACK438_01125 [Flavobacteriales bacterium]|jgi:hypothetical protein
MGKYRWEILVFFLSTSLWSQSQDVIFNRTGERISCTLVENTKEYVSYFIMDSNALSLVSKDQLLCVKAEGNSAEKCFKNDTLVSRGNQNSLFLVGKVLNISPDSVTLFTIRGEEAVFEYIPINNVLLIKLSNGDIEKFYEQSRQAQTVSSYELGRLDAKEYYRTPNGVIVTEVISGLFLYPGLISMVVAFVPPRKLDNPKNPNNILLKTDSEYYNGYQKQAKKRKVKDSLISLFSGFVTTLGILIIVNL